MKHKKLHADGKSRTNQLQHVGQSTLIGSETVELSIEIENEEK